MIDKFPKGGIRMMQDVHQIEAFRIPLHVELTELMEMKVTLKMDCASKGNFQETCYKTFSLTCRPRLYNRDSQCSTRLTRKP